MDDQPGHLANTREFMAMWNTVTAEHLTHKLASVLRELPDRAPGAPGLDPAEAEALAALLVRAFQVAASPDGGVHAAVQYLSEYGGDTRA